MTHHVIITGEGRMVVEASLSVRSRRQTSKIFSTENPSVRIFEAYVCSLCHAGTVLGHCMARYLWEMLTFQWESSCITL